MFNIGLMNFIYLDNCGRVCIRPCVFVYCNDSNYTARAYEQTFFRLAKNIPFSNLNPFPFKPKKTKIREVNFYDMQTISLFLSLCLSINLQYLLFGKGSMM